MYGPLGYGFSTWDEKSNGEKRINRLKLNHEFAMHYVENYIDELYLTSNDPGKANPMELIEDCASYITNNIVVKKIEDRKEALKQIILDSNDNDVIYIAGRGDRIAFCKNEFDLDFYTDREIVEEVIQNGNYTK